MPMSAEATAAEPAAPFAATLAERLLTSPAPCEQVARGGATAHGEGRGKVKVLC